MEGNTMFDEKNKSLFFGREDALDAFYRRFSYRHMKNGIYYCGKGGYGKTWILKKIIVDNQGDPIRKVTPIIDFYDTKNHNVRGLQDSIKTRLQNSDAFKQYDNILNLLKEARINQDISPSAIANLESRIDKVFIECCKDAIVGKEIIIIFDTFEFVQTRYVGEWLCDKFLPNVGDLIVVIAGRPDPQPAKMPDNILTWELKGLDLEPYIELVRNSKFSYASIEIIKLMWKHTAGIPLLAYLIIDMFDSDREDFIKEIEKLKEDELVQDIPKLRRWLVAQFAAPNDTFNKIFWAMSYLHRRFDIPMLKYLVENTEWFKPNNYDLIFKHLTNNYYVKDYVEQQSHLLHDEIQQMVANYVLPGLGIWEEWRDNLYDVIVNEYYPSLINSKMNASPKTAEDISLEKQLRAEQLGYIIDRDHEKGYEKYKGYREEIEDTIKDYDFEELIWGEVRNYLDKWEENIAYEICLERGQWLHKHSLYNKAEKHYQQMSESFTINQIEIQDSLGFMFMRQGKLEQASYVFEENLKSVQLEDSNSIGRIENNLGQLARRSGKWDKALEHYSRSFKAATMHLDKTTMVSVYINRGYLYSLIGQYTQAKKQCEQAIELLEVLPETPDNKRREMYAWLNLGTAYRHSAEYTVAEEYYQLCLKLARENNNSEVICQALQHRGINAHLLGHKYRQEQEEASVVIYQHRLAFKSLMEALEIARQSDDRENLASGMNRFGKVYREFYRAQYLKIYELQDAKKLMEEAEKYRPPYELNYTNIFLTKTAFSDGDWLEKAARLFEISAILADEVNDFHLALESWAETARIYEELGMEQAVLLVLKKIERLKGNDYQADLYSAIQEMILADLDFRQENYKRALVRYSNSYLAIAKQTGYALYLLNDRLKDLEWRSAVLPPEVALEWCNVLEDRWEQEKIADSWMFTLRPEMRDALERIRKTSIQRKLKEA